MTRRRLLLLSSTALIATMSLWTPRAGAEDGPPSVSVDRTGTKAGESITVRGDGWTGSDLIYVELCGNAGRNGSRSCDQGHATLTGIGPDGGFAATLTVANPPAPCPCVVKATSQTTQAFATAPVAVQGVPVVALEDQTTMTQVARAIDITEVRITGHRSWASWFGGSDKRTLVLTVENTGEVAVHDPPLTIRSGQGSSPDGIVPAPDLGTIEPGDSSTVEVPLEFGPLTFGKHSATVSIAGFEEPVAGGASVSIYPWGAIALAVLLLQLILLSLRNAARRRLEGAGLWDEAEAAAITVPPAPALELEPVIDPVIEPVSAGAAVQVARAVPEVPYRQLGSDPLIDDWLRIQDPPGTVVAGLPQIDEAARDEPDLLRDKEWPGHDGQSARAALEEARTLSASILEAATMRADAIVTQAMAMRSGAAAVLEEARLTVEHMINIALVNAEAIRQEADDEQRAAAEATAAARAEIDQMMAEATRAVEARSAAIAALPSPESGNQHGEVIDLTEARSHGAHRVNNGLDLAIERAVQKALQS